MALQALVKLLWPKHVLVKLTYRFTLVMPLNFVKCMSEWAQKKSDNYLRKLSKLLLPLFILTKLMRWEIGKAH
jgi:hypothetical protein